MKPVMFPQANTQFGPPPGMSEEQVASIPACSIEIGQGNLDGMSAVIVAWQPDDVDLARLLAGAPVFLLSCGGLNPHCLTTEFPVNLLAKNDPR